VTSDPRTSLGRSGEEAALSAYISKGFDLVARNWRCSIGEIDLVVERGGLLVFCEVKTRSGSGFGGGYEAVAWAKQRKLRQLAELFLSTLGRQPERVRFDVASISLTRGGRAEVHVFEDAF
jgi:putative endonuclease